MGIDQAQEKGQTPASEIAFATMFSKRPRPFSVLLIQILLQFLFGLASFFKRARATHTYGIAATGFARIEPDPAFPDHDFFAPGTVFPVVLRHANLTYADGCRRDIRGAALRFGGFEGYGFFDMPMNTGVTSAFWDLPSFLSFLRLSPQKAGLQRYLEAFPLAKPAALDGLHWGPSSFANLGYYSQIVYRFVGKDGKLWFIRYRLLPDGRPPEEAAFRDIPAWEDARRPDDNRPSNYLQEEYRQRLLRAPIEYRFQAQIREPSDDPEVRNSGRAWDDLPWLDLAAITIETVISDEETKHLAFNIGNHPESLGLLPAVGWRDYNALALVRVPVYRFSSLLRFARKSGARPRWDHALYSPFPRARKYKGRIPQTFSFGRTKAFFTPSLIRSMLVYKFTEAMGRWGLFTSKQIQRFHKPNATLLQERKEPGSSRSDAAFVDRLINGFYPVPLFQKDGDPSRFVAEFRWDREQFDGDLGLTNARIHLRLEGETLVPESIAIQFRSLGESGPFPSMEEEEIALPSDKGRWELAKQFVQTSICLEGQALGHFVECHINMEQYAVAAFRRLQGHPLAPLLFPHLKEVVAINRQGEGIIFGETGILCVNSALSADSASSLFVRHLGGLSWSDFKPRPPVCLNDLFGRISGLYWKIVKEHVASYIETRKDEIQEKWAAVYAFSQDLVFHSVPYAPRNRVQEAQRFGQIKSMAERIALRRVEKALPPITLRLRSPEASDWDNLIQAASYAIFHATLYHTWTNDRMHESLGEAAYMSFGLRDADLRDAWKGKIPITLYPPPVPVAYQLFLVNFLVSLRYGLLIANETKDVPLSLIKSLEVHEKDFAALGLDIRVIRSCINI